MDNWCESGLKTEKSSENYMIHIYMIQKKFSQIE